MLDEPVLPPLVPMGVAAVFGPLPPSVTAVAWGGQAIWLLVLWGYWVDRHRARKEALRAS